MAWIVLLFSAVLEAVWATALGRSENLSRLYPSLVFGVAVVASMAGLAYAMRDLPFTWPTALFLAMIVGGVVGLKAVH